MTGRLTTEQLKVIRKRAEEATEGPWLNTGGKFGEAIVMTDDYDENITDEVIYVVDAEFIAHAREDIPALLAEVERLRAELAEVVGQTCRFANVKCRKGESE